MNPVHEDIRLLSDIRDEYRSWLAHPEIDLLHDLELQAWSGWTLSVHQRRIVERMVETAADRRSMAASLAGPGTAARVSPGRPA